MRPPAAAGTRPPTGRRPTWDEVPPPPPARLGPGDWLRVLWRGAALGTVTFGGLALLLTLRLVERPLHGMNRPWTPQITCLVCRAALAILGLRYRSHGAPMRGQGAVVANHASWLDIFVLNARKRIYFVSKAEVARWPAIGWLARATGTLFITRDPREAAAQRALFTARLQAGHRLLFFPEGTSTDGQRVLPFKSTLFAAFFTPELRARTEVQPVSVVYRAPPGRDARFHAWWGDMAFGPHLVQVLAARPQGAVEVIYHPPLRVSDFADRKALARACEAAVRAGLEAARSSAQSSSAQSSAGPEVAGPVSR